MRSRSPQEKKAISYAKDRRNNYGENDKSSRKNIPRNKRSRWRAERKRERQAFTGVLGPADAALAERAEERFAGRRPKRVAGWRKHPDRALGDHLVSRLKLRVGKGIDDPQTAQARIARIRQRRLTKS